MALFDRICAEVGDETLGPPGSRPEQRSFRIIADKESGGR
jgi:hypothetical protein